MSRLPNKATKSCDKECAARPNHQEEVATNRPSDGRGWLMNPITDNNSVQALRISDTESMWSDNVVWYSHQMPVGLAGTSLACCARRDPTNTRRTTCAPNVLGPLNECIYTAKVEILSGGHTADALHVFTTLTLENTFGEYENRHQEDRCPPHARYGPESE